ncbi:protein of unknown function [Pseudorhizobium banfieldiae]|uniref:Uncharacterized protein n=1 Tax=Pseudorhizobium banfieldiae TaxID=1125847 RepID=L0NL25_9HYPH|nr:protein of unknown function [Pseudorhizobium banfieldiae]
MSPPIVALAALQRAARLAKANLFENNAGTRTVSVCVAHPFSRELHAQPHKHDGIRPPGKPCPGRMLHDVRHNGSYPRRNQQDLHRFLRHGD